MSGQTSVVAFDLEKDEATVLAVRSRADAPAMTKGDVFPIARFGDVKKLAFGVPRQVDDLPAVENPTDEQKRLLEAGVKSYVVVPLRARDKLIGSLNVGFSLPNETTEEAVLPRWSLGISLRSPSGKLSYAKTWSGTPRTSSVVSRS